MTLRRVKTIYCLSIIAVAIILASHGGILEWAASIAMLAGALPVLRKAQRLAAAHERERVLREVTAAVVSPEHRDSH